MWQWVFGSFENTTHMKSNQISITCPVDKMWWTMIRLIVALSLSFSFLYLSLCFMVPTHSLTNAQSARFSVIYFFVRTTPGIKYSLFYLFLWLSSIREQEEPIWWESLEAKIRDWDFSFSSTIFQTEVPCPCENIWYWERYPKCLYHFLSKFGFSGALDS